MPTYSYECTKCQSVTDVFHGISASPKVKCPSCGGRTQRMLGTGAGLIFKGSGFYETDFKDKKGTPDKPAETKSEGGAAASDQGGKKSEASKPKESAKPAAKADKPAAAKTPS